MNPDQLKEILAAVMELPCMKWCDEQMKAKAAYEEGLEPETDQATKAPEDAQSTVPPNAKPKPNDKEQFAEDVMPKEEEKKEFQEEDEEEKSQMKSNQAKRQYAKLQTEYKSLFDKVAALERKERIATRKVDLMQLTGEGYVFDEADELGVVADYDDTRYKKHIQLIKKNYKKAPIGSNIKVESIPEEGRSGVAKVPYNPREVMIKAYEKAAERNKR